jgi:hypothetical protein
MKKFLISGLFFFILAAYSAAQTFTAELNKRSVGLNEEFEISFVYSATDLNNLSSFTPPEFRDFTILTGPNQAQSMQIINGAMSGSRSFSYYLQPKKEGTFTIGHASITAGGKTYTTEPVSITVTKAAQQSKSSSSSGSNNATADIAGNVFIKASVDKSRAAVGEQITVTYKLYTRLNIGSSYNISKMPSYLGFWSEDLDPSQRVSFGVETYEGKQFRTAVIKKMALFPAKEGRLTITPFELTIPVEVQRKRRSSGSVFDDFFNDPFFNAGQMVNFDAKSNAVVVTADPLPIHAPASFKGAVGDYSLRVTTDKNVIKSNEPFTIKISISGTGNIKLIQPPDISIPQSFEKYEPKTSEKVNNSGRISGEKTIEYLVIPRNTGNYEIPPIEFSYYNPAQKKYVTLNSQKLNLNVQKGDASFEGGLAGYGKSDVELLKQDIRFIKTSEGVISRKGDYAIFSFWFWTITVLPLLALTVGIFWKRKNDELAGNMEAFRYQKAEKIAKNNLKSAKKFLDARNKEGFYTEISSALFGYLEDKLKIPKAEFSMERARLELHAKSFSDGLIEKVINCAERCEFARFAPASDLSAEMNNFYNQTVSLIADLEKSFQTKK